MMGAITSLRGVHADGSTKYSNLYFFITMLVFSLWTVYRSCPSCLVCTVDAYMIFLSIFICMLNLILVFRFPTILEKLSKYFTMLSVIVPRVDMTGMPEKFSG